MAKTTPIDEKLEKQDFDLFEALAAIDRKDYGYFDSLSEEQKNKFSATIIMGFISSVKSKPEIEQFYILSTNEYANKHLYNEVVTKHPKLQWYMLCAAGLGQGKQYHVWIPQLKAKYFNLKEKLTVKEMQDYLKKVDKTLSDSEVKTIADMFVEAQNKKFYLGNKFPNLKLDDVETLSQLVTQDDIKKYDEEHGQ